MRKTSIGTANPFDTRKSLVNGLEDEDKSEYRLNQQMDSIEYDQSNDCMSAAYYNNG